MCGGAEVVVAVPLAVVIILENQRDVAERVVTGENDLKVQQMERT